MVWGPSCWCKWVDVSAGVMAQESSDDTVVQLNKLIEKKVGPSSTIAMHDVVNYTKVCCERGFGIWELGVRCDM
eukprot:779061-Rhodomonas_salina.2